MPARCQRNGESQAASAARTYLQAIADGDSLTVAAVVERFGVTRGALHNALTELRKERR